MATPRLDDPTHCHGCGNRLPTYNRLTLPRAVTGDLAFCGYRCLTSWQSRAPESGEAL